MISEQLKREWKTMVMVHSEDHTPANENHARYSGGHQYAAAVLPTIDQKK